MATAGANSLPQCCCCEKDLDVDSHTLACLHNVCHACKEGNTPTEGSEPFEVINACPKCGEVFTDEESHLLPFLSTDIKRQWEQKCVICTEKGVTSIGNHWCHTCDKLFCNNCNFYHVKLLKNHICENIEGTDHAGWISLVMSDRCFAHNKDRELFCRECNVCFCETCYHEGHPRSGCLSSRFFKVKDEVVKWKDEEGFLLEKEVKQLQKRVKRSSTHLKSCQDEFSASCRFEIKQIWQRYEAKVELARIEAIELCEVVSQEHREEERRVRRSLDANDKILPKIELCLSHCRRLLGEEGESDRDTDCLRTLNRLNKKVRSWQEERNRAEVKVERIDLSIDFSNLLIDFPLNDKTSPLSPRVRICKEIPQIKEFEQHKEWTLKAGLNTRRIRSIHITKEDDHVFLADWGNDSIVELSERGEMLSELRFEEDYRLCFTPFDVCSISPDTLAVCGEGSWRGEGKIVILERKKNHPYLRLQKIIKTKKPFFCLCWKNESLYCCDFLFKINSFTKDGKKLKTIKVDGLTTGSMGSSWSIWSRIHIDPLTGNFWGSRLDSDVISFNFEGEQLDSLKKVGKEFFDFAFDKYGHLYFPTKEGIFSLSPETKTVYKFPEKKHLYKFSKKAKLDFPVISISENKMVVWIKNEGKDLIKHFKIFY